MNNKLNNLREFGKFRLDAKKKVLWFENETVNLQLKEIELLCVLTENGGEVITKDELLNRVWADSFVEESNLSRHIYRIRKVFKEHGESEDLIKTVPRRGYRFTGEIKANGNDLIIEKHSISRTVIEEIETSDAPQFKKVSARRFFVLTALLAVILTTAFGFYFYKRSSPNTQQIKSIAVLPVKSFAGVGADDEELRWQMTDFLITKLGKLPDVSVRPTATVLRFAKSEQSIFEIGKKLEVEAVLDGRIQREGETIRVTLQLVSVESGEQIWSEVFDGRSNQILNLQDRISAKVLDSLNQNRQQNIEIAQRPTQNEEAYEAYLKARYFGRRSEGQSLRKSLELFETAVRLDANFAEGYAGIADVRYRLFMNNFNSSVEDVEKAKANIQKALSLKSELVEPLLTLGQIQTTYDWDWAKAEETWKKILEIEPQLAAARMRYGMLLMFLSRFNEAQAQMEEAIRLDPTHPSHYANLGTVYFCRKDFAKAEEFYKKALELDENWVFAHWYLSRMAWLQGRKNESLKYVVSGSRINGQNEFAEKVEEKSRTQTPEEVTRFIIEEWSKNADSYPSVANRAMYLGDRETALTYLEKSFTARNPWLVMIAASPEFETLRGEPRFQEILQKMNLK